MFLRPEEQGVVVERGGQPLLLERAGAQVLDQPRHLALGGLGGRFHLTHHLGQVGRHVPQGVEAGADAAGRHGQAEQVLFDAVVQFAGQPVALFDHGQRADLVGEARVALLQFIQVLLVLFQVAGQQVQLPGEFAQVIGRRVGDAWGEVAAQPGLGGFERIAQAAGDAAAGPRSQQCPDQGGDERHQQYVGIPEGLGERWLVREQDRDSQRYPLGQEYGRQRHRRVGEGQFVLQFDSWTGIALHARLL